MSAPSKKVEPTLKSTKIKKEKKVDWSKYCGIIKLKEDSLVLQKRWRNEW